MSDRPKLTITYCTQCNWLLRAGWMAQEVLQTFSLELGEVGLIPGTGGIFEIRLDGELIWERKRDGGFPDVKQLKQLVRDRIDPERDLGHIDRVHRGAEYLSPPTHKVSSPRKRGPNSPSRKTKDGSPLSRG
jgi:selenoprotein W-related protein